MIDYDKNPRLERLHFNVCRYPKIGVAFHGVTKCGTTTIKTHLRKLSGLPDLSGLLAVHNIANLDNGDHEYQEGLVNFAVVRNPRARHASIYNQYKHKFENEQHLLEFIAENRDHRGLNPHLRTQSRIVHLDPRIRILALEHLKEQWAREVPTAPPTERLFANTTPSARAALNPDLWNEVYAADEELWRRAVGILETEYSYYHYPPQSHIEFEWLCQIVRENKPRHILEVGSRHGRSLVRLAEAAMPTLERVTVIDLPAGPWGVKGSNDHLKDAVDMLRDRGIEVNYLPFSSRGAEAMALATHQDFKIDFAFIDGDHTYEGVLSDYRTFWPALRDGGLMAFHDIKGNPRNAQVEVPQFWAEFRGNNFDECVDPRRIFGIGIKIK